MTALEVFTWAIAGGVFVAILSVAAAFSQKERPTNKQLSRDFLLGAAFTGFVYPLIPDTFDDIKDVLKTTSGNFIPTGTYDPGVQVGPANF